MPEFLKINEIIIKDRVRKDLGDINQLAASIGEIGLLHPVVVYEKDDKFYLLAGQRRIEAFKILTHDSIPASIVSLQDILKAELHENTVRKDFTFSEMSVLDDEFAPQIEKEFKERQGHEHLGNLPKGQSRTSEVMASYFGKGERTYRKFKDIKNAVKNNKEFEDIPKRIDNGMSVDYAHKMINNEIKQTTPTPDLPEGEYELVYIDLPWKYDLELSGSPDYKTMTLEEMKEEIKIPAAENCIMFMWATNPKLLDALALLEYWGFTYKTKIEWIKMKDDHLQPGTGYYAFGCDEMLLIAIKGSPGTPVVKAKPNSVIIAPKTSTHSEKPKKFYEIIEGMYPAKNKIEMFARNKRDGWTSWGDGVDG